MGMAEDRAPDFLGFGLTKSGSRQAFGGIRPG